jgi:hypothetical protein
MIFVVTIFIFSIISDFVLQKKITLGLSGVKGSWSIIRMGNISKHGLLPGDLVWDNNLIISIKKQRAFPETFDFDQTQDAKGAYEKNSDCWWWYCGLDECAGYGARVD